MCVCVCVKPLRKQKLRWKNLCSETQVCLNYKNSASPRPFEKTKECIKGQKLTKKGADQTLIVDDINTIYIYIQKMARFGAIHVQDY